MQTWRLDSDRQSLVLASDGGIPVCIYWGAPLPKAEDLTQLAHSVRPDMGGSMPDDVAPISLCPEQYRLFTGHPGMILRDQDGKIINPALKLTTVDQIDNHWTAETSGDGITLTFSIRLDADSDVFSLSTALKSDKPIEVAWLAAPVLPAPSHLPSMTHFAGRWRDEFQPKETRWQMGQLVRENRTGRTEHAHFPGLLLHDNAALNTGGDTFGFHYGWSGGHRMIAEQLPDGRRQVQFGHMPDDSRKLVTFAETAPLYVAFGPDGKNDIARSFQQHLRNHILHYANPDRPRPVHYNCWEAIYFDHDLDVLADIVARAADLGAERFVLDDGWFGRRDDDTSSLGDWWIDTRKYPEGLTPLIEQVKARGMTFGIWFEPEMVNKDSDLYRAHPDWILGRDDQVTGRYQLVLDMANGEVRDYLFDAISAILGDHDIDYVKWDHNRILPVVDQAQAEGFYDLLDRLNAAHPHVEFESCSSGGGRIDFGVLSRTGRVWLSDSNDALERVRIQHDAALFLPFEVTGSHIGPRDCHTTHRQYSALFRAWVVAQRHMGFEADPRELTDNEKADVKSVIQWWKANRDWMRQAAILRLDSADPVVTGEIQVSNDNTRFVAFICVTDTMESSLPLPIRLTGLQAGQSYVISAQASQAPPHWTTHSAALRDQSLTLSGQALMQSGIILPQSFPATMWVIEGRLAS